MFKQRHVIENVIVFSEEEEAIDDEARQRAEAVLSRQVQNKYGKHHYANEDFGMSAAQIDRNFAAYRSLYDIPSEGTS